MVSCWAQGLLELVPTYWCVELSPRPSVCGTVLKVAGGLREAHSCCGLLLGGAVSLHVRLVLGFPGLILTGWWLGPGSGANKLEGLLCNGTCQCQCPCSRMSASKLLPPVFMSPR